MVGKPISTARWGCLAKLSPNLLVSLTLMVCAARAQQTPIDTELAKAYFRDAQVASDRDHGSLWGQELYGRLLFIDPETHAIVANQPDREGSSRHVMASLRASCPQNSSRLIRRFNGPAWTGRWSCGRLRIVRGANGVIRVQVPAPTNPKVRPLKGTGWTLELTSGWTLAPGPRPGDFTLKQN